ncbi:MULTISPECIES: aerobic respiration two-component sensor histidine kinase ArcB [Vibrio]|uniref:aerobic respiration two-component sensor histidine kinase ArcB n=1 Tax=Vibrio TaxID=662 RepID=UPI000B5C1F2C|nr:MULTISPECIES: aerobic respiration two-component sensor histidine kinase ArcB [Vibrio]HBV75092.1 aerobic respiration two-component sensor histidine kinase ArcB [Vibrio sp.]
MKPLKNLARYYVDLLVKLGIARFSILLALALVCFSVLLQVSVSLVLRGEIENIVIIRSVFFGLLITPWAVYFLTVVVDQLEKSRQRLTSMVFKLKDMRARDRELNVELQENLRKLHQQMEEREKAEVERFEAIQDLENEVYQREKTQVELAERTALMRSFLDASPDLIYYRNTNGEFSGCNKAFEELVGLPEKKLVGLSIYDVYSDDCTRQQVEATDAKVFQYNKELTYEIWLQYPDNKRAYFEFRKLPFYNKDNQLLGLVGFGRDITERKVYQDALVKASQDKTTFISTISHELRTPLNGIVGLSRILLDSKLDEYQRKYMQTINVSAITLGHIFNDVIDLDKFDRSELELLAVETDFHSFITDIESISGLMAEQKGLRFELDRLSELPHGILVDATRLRQVLWNLVSNAMKFTKEGGVSVNVSADFDNEYAEIQFDIEDTGIGIPESEIDNIFGMYYQVKSGKDNLHAVGTGIGLAVSQEITHRMGGEITVNSELGFGSTFSVSIRVPVVKLGYESEPHFYSKSSLRIFMVEDIELNITVACSVLENLGHSVEVAMSGEEALAKFHPQDYDLVLLDIQLPDMTGFDIAQQLRRTYKKLPPLVALTANVLKDKHTYLQGGMDDAISKPLSVKAIYKIIEQCIEGSLHNDLYLHSGSLKEETLPFVSLEKKSIASLDLAKTEDEEGVLDKEMLNAYIDIVGSQLVMNSVVMFEETMPNYMTLLNLYLESGDDENLVSEAHKIKGAAGSVGLQRIQQLAQKVQSPEEENWKRSVGKWVTDIDQVYQSDINTLKQWLQQKG